MANDQVLAQYLTAHPRSPYSLYAREFITFVGDGPLDKAAVKAFIEAKRQRGYKSQSLILIFGVVRAMCNLAGVPWPFRRGEGPRFEYDDNAPAYDPRAVEQMIRAAMGGKYNPAEACVLALLTTYGLRRVEIARLRPPHLHLQEGILTVPLAKNGEPREHQVPAEIAPYLSAWGFEKPLSTQQVGAIWYQLLLGAGLPYVPGFGPHSVRRTLSTLLRDAVGADATRAFFGWSRRSPDMARRYYRTRFGGYEGEQVHQPRERREIDERVFAKHPFLQHWRMTSNRMVQVVERDQRWQKGSDL